MRTIYVDMANEYKCYAYPGPGLTPCDTDAFDGKCQEYIEGYRYVPPGHTWDDGGIVNEGEMKVPWRDHSELQVAQLEYELTDADEALREVGVANG